MRLAKFVLLTMLLGSCGSNLPAPNPVRPCEVPATPAYPEVEPFACPTDPTLVCLSMEDTVELTEYIMYLQLIDEALLGCNLVKRVPL